MAQKPKVDVQGLQERLRVRRDELIKAKEQAGNPHRAVNVDQSQVGRLNRIEAIQEQAMAIEAERRRQTELGHIEAALKRIENGSYGYCVTCGERIAPKRLEHDPAVRQCINCARGTA